MIKPYQNDINLLESELEHFTFVMQRAAQEHDETMTKYFSSLCYPRAPSTILPCALFSILHHPLPTPLPTPHLLLSPSSGTNVFLGFLSIFRRQKRPRTLAA